MKTLIGLLTAILLIFTSTVSFAAPVKYKNCKKLNAVWPTGLQFRCADGIYFVLQPGFDGSYTDPYVTYRGRDSNGNSLKCKYNSFRSTYTCR